MFLHESDGVLWRQLVKSTSALTRSHKVRDVYGGELDAPFESTSNPQGFISWNKSYEKLLRVGNYLNYKHAHAMSVHMRKV